MIGWIILCHPIMRAGSKNCISSLRKYQRYEHEFFEAYKFHGEISLLLALWDKSAWDVEVLESNSILWACSPYPHCMHICSKFSSWRNGGKKDLTNHALAHSCSEPTKFLWVYGSSEGVWVYEWGPSLTITDALGNQKGLSFYSCIDWCLCLAWKQLTTR